MAIVFSDNFNRSNGPLGDSWSEIHGTPDWGSSFAVILNQFALDWRGDVILAQPLVGSALDDFTLSFVLSDINNAKIWFRASETDGVSSGNYIALQGYFTGGVTRVSIAVDNWITNPPYGTYLTSAEVGDKITFVVSGNSFTIKVNDVSEGPTFTFSPVNASGNIYYEPKHENTGFDYFITMDDFVIESDVVVPETQTAEIDEATVDFSADGNIVTIQTVIAYSCKLLDTLINIVGNYIWRQREEKDATWRNRR